jgi:hypothetical protein
MERESAHRTQVQAYLAHRQLLLRDEAPLYQLPLDPRQVERPFAQPRVTGTVGRRRGSFLGLDTVVDILATFCDRTLGAIKWTNSNWARYSRPFPDASTNCGPLSSV